MTVELGVNGTLVSNGDFPIAKAEQLLEGLFLAPTIASRNAIGTAYRGKKCCCFVFDDGNGAPAFYYINDSLDIGDNANWLKFSPASNKLFHYRGTINIAGVNSLDDATGNNGEWYELNEAGTIVNPALGENGRSLQPKDALVHNGDSWQWIPGSNIASIHWDNVTNKPQKFPANEAAIDYSLIPSLASAINARLLRSDVLTAVNDNAPSASKPVSEAALVAKLLADYYTRDALNTLLANKVSTQAGYQLISTSVATALNATPPHGHSNSAVLALLGAAVVGDTTYATYEGNRLAYWSEKEPTIAVKGSAFNKSFGTEPGNVPAIGLPGLSSDGVVGVKEGEVYSIPVVSPEITDAAVIAALADAANWDSHGHWSPAPNGSASAAVLTSLVVDTFVYLGRYKYHIATGTPHNIPVRSVVIADASDGVADLSGVATGADASIINALLARVNELASILREHGLISAS